MTEQQWGPEFADFAALIHGCCDDISDKQFERFRLAWRGFLQADLTQFTSDGHAVEKVFDLACAEYRAKFGAGYSPAFDYALYFRAVAYAHLSHLQGHAGIRELLRNIGGTGGFETVDHYCCVFIFVNVLKIGDECTPYLLDACFELASVAADSYGCIGFLEETWKRAGL
jgi:hypothetical protein